MDIFRVQPGQQTQAPNTSQIPPSSTKDGLDVPLKPDAGSAQGGISK
jgi:hypothetical protein